MCFNLAYAIYKLKDPTVDFMRIWREEINDIYYKTLAQFNLAVVTFYQNLAQPSKTISLDSVNETMNHFDFTMSQINQMMNSFLNPTTNQQL
jgi:DNA-directed RNA polymerase delta subunit